MSAKSKNKATKKSHKHYDVIRPKQSKHPVASRTSMEPSKEAAELEVVVAKASALLRAKQKSSKAFKRIIRPASFGRMYSLVSVLILALTTVLWSLLGARLQSGNADQLVDPRLFQDHLTLEGAQFPGAHTFLIKWPLFWLIHLLDNSNTAFITITVGSVLATIAVLVFILYKIERRPAVFGTLCLALASVLLLVPAQPYAGAILPVNMAMLATRNLEYALFLLSLVAIIRARSWRNWQFFAGVIGLALLIASDKLFLALSIGAAIGMLLVYALRQRPQLIGVSAHWLLGGLLAAAGGFGLLAAINVLGVAHIVSGVDSSPYAAIHNSHDLILGLIYGGLGLLTNFGANPAYDATRLHDIAGNAQDRLLSIGGLGFVVNMVILLAGLFAAWQLTQRSLRAVKNADKRIDMAHILSLALILVSLVAGGLFVATNHYYAVDARYLTISLFAVFIAAATYGRQRQWKRKHVVIAGGVILLAICASIPTVLTTYSDQRAAYDTVNQRNHLVMQALRRHPVTTLVGDYWRVLPIKQSTRRHPINVLPMADCTTPRNTLISTAWQPDLKKYSFAYLVTLDGSLTDFPVCSLNTAIAAHGRPDSTLLVAGTYAKPAEMLLFYDHGSHPTVKKSEAPAVASTLLPLTADQLGKTNCEGPSTMTIVAHQDDDLLFTSPDLLRDIKNGNCMRTLYITAGDAGHGEFYWLSREQGSEAAYDEMDGPGKDVWVQRTLLIAPKQYLTIASPRDNPKITLLFLHLPDGNITGMGFPQSHFESLDKLLSGRIDSIRTVDGQSDYGKDQLVATVATLMHIYNPSEIHTQTGQNQSDVYPDHSDHLAVGQLTKLAYDRYEQQQYANQLVIPIKYYVGYPTHAFEVNVYNDDLQQKEAAFLAYAKFDGSVCGSVVQCAETATYGSYLTHQYTVDR